MEEKIDKINRKNQDVLEVNKPKLIYKSMFYQDKKVEGSIVNILTRNDAKTSVWAPKKPGRIISDLIGLNSVCQGKPVNLGWHGGYERGFLNPQKEDALYLIDADRKIINCVPNSFNLFYDQDKVMDKNTYIWYRTFEELLEEFKRAGYGVVDRSVGIK